MKTFQYYKNTIFYSSLISILLVIPISIIINHDYQSEWISRETAISMDIIFAIFYAFVMSIFCLPILLTHYIYRNKLLVLLCWFFCPIVLMTLALINHLDIQKDLNTDQDFGFYYLYLGHNLPFLMMLIWTYIEYRKNLVQ